MKLQKLDIFLTWDDIMSLFDSLGPKGVDIDDIEPNGASFGIVGKASKFCFTVNWSVCVEPMPSHDDRDLVFHVESFDCEGFKLYKNLWRFDWSLTPEESLVQTCASHVPGLWASEDYLGVDLRFLLSKCMNTDSPVKVGKIKSFSANKSGIRLVIENK